MIMHAGLFPAARGNEILIGKPMRLDMDQGYPGHWTVRDAAKYDLQVSTVERLIRGDRFTPEEAREVNMKIYDKLVDNLFSCRLDS